MYMYRYNMLSVIDRKCWDEILHSGEFIVFCHLREASLP